MSILTPVSTSGVFVWNTLEVLISKHDRTLSAPEKGKICLKNEQISEILPS
jgi:hypothetical protein